MAEKKIGICSYCEKEFSKVILKNHYKKCEKKPQVSNGVEEFFMISVEGYYNKEYWLYISVSTKATLEDIDSFLRDIWLECCGHLSSFEINGEMYESATNELYFVKTMSVKVNKVLSEGLVFKHDYDFGSTTRLKLKVLSTYSDVKRKQKVELVARNVEPIVKCSECEEIATNICANCGDWLCDKCSEDHVCGEEMLLPVVNSPRTGVCGYCG